MYRGDRGAPAASGRSTRERLVARRRADRRAEVRDARGARSSPSYERALDGRQAARRSGPKPPRGSGLWRGDGEVARSDARPRVAARACSSGSAARSRPCRRASRPPQDGRSSSRERREDGRGSGPLDWGTAEALAFGSLLLEGTPVRLERPGLRAAARSATATPSCTTRRPARRTCRSRHLDPEQARVRRLRQPALGVRACSASSTATASSSPRRS